MVDGMLATPAGHIKVVSTAHTLSDLERVLALYSAIGNQRRRLLAFSMGAAGLPTRFLSPLLGAPIACAAWDEDSPAAPGQVGIKRMESVLSHLHGLPQRLYGVVGADVSRSLSPTMHSAGYRSEELPYVFVPVNVPDEHQLEELFVPQGSTLFDRVGLPVFGWAVTSPYKRAAARSATLAAPRVRRSNAANTMILRSNQVIAENTDADGVVGSLTSHGVDPAGRRALVQGTGGAARGAAVGLDAAGAVVALRGRDENRTRAVAEQIGVSWCATDVFPDGTELLINATPLGRSENDPSPFDRAHVERAAAVVDMVYAGHTTSLARYATDSGVVLMDGREMLLHQGFAQFAAFTGRLPPKDAMREALEDAP